jgi:hypothetical protein
MFDIAILDEPAERFLQPAGKKNHYTNREETESVLSAEERHAALAHVYLELRLPIEVALLAARADLADLDAPVVKKVREPEERHWKLSAQAASPKVAVIEVAILIVCAAFAVVGGASCLAQLSHLL